MVEDKGNSETSSPNDLQISEIRYRRLFESARDGILILNAVTRKITDVNPFMIELLGYTREEFLGRELWEIGLLKDEEESIAAFRELQKKGYIRYDDLPLRNRNGARREVEFVSNVYGENGHQVIQCNIRDISERKNAENALRQAEQKYESLFANAVTGIYQTTLDGHYIAANPMLARMFGYDSPEEMINEVTGEQTLERRFYVEQGRREEFARLIREHGVLTGFESEIYTRDGKRIWISEHALAIRNEFGQVTGYQGTTIDITATKDLERQLRQAQRLESIGLLAGGIAHDFNNMLTAINGYSDLTLRRLKADDPLRRNLEEIKKAGLRSAALTQQLLAFSRRQVLQPVVLNLNVIISDTIKMLQRLIGEDIQLTTTLNPQVGQVKVDPGQFSQIVMNLAVNARDAMPQGGKLIIETANIFLDSVYTAQHVGVLPGAYVMFSICDTGAGMSDEIKQHVFEPFFTTKKAGQGTGLGLATVYGIVKQSGGYIEVYSDEGVGTTFKIYLPRVAEQSGATTAKTASAEMSRGTETILVVEDEDVVRNLSKDILKECGYTVIEARDGVEALELCDKGECRFDLLMTDVVMPRMGGRELVEKLSARLPEMRVLFTSGYTDDAVLRHGVIKADTNFIHKPFTPEALANKIREIFDAAPNSTSVQHKIEKDF